jgi:hypothetical protein
MIFPRFLANLTNLLCKSFRPVCHNIACRQTMLSRVSIRLCRKCWNKSKGSLISSKTPFPDPLYPKNNKKNTNEQILFTFMKDSSHILSLGHYHDCCLNTHHIEMLELKAKWEGLSSNSITNIFVRQRTTTSGRLTSM